MKDAARRTSSDLVGISAPPAKKQRNFSQNSQVVLEAAEEVCLEFEQQNPRNYMGAD